MVSGLLRVIFGFGLACLVAGAATAAFVITPADIATLPAELRTERLESAGTLSLLAATHSAIFAFPFALVAIVIGEWWCVRSWIYYTIAGILIALAGFGAEYLNEVSGQPTIVNDYAVRAFLIVGVLSGLAYWLVSGRYAGGGRGDARAASRQARSEPPAGDEPAEATK